VSLELVREGGLVWLEFGAGRGNVLDAAQIDALAAAVQALAQEEEVRCLAFTGRGRDFCWGASVPEHQKEQAPQMLATFHAFFRLLEGGEDTPFATGHFYGMTTHARGGLFLDPEARAVVDAGALHGRAVSMDGRAKVESYRMTSQCASGSGQFLENIARYLGVSLDEVGTLSMQSANPEKVSSICAVLAETDVINMVSRGITTSDILRGIHLSMAGRFSKLLRALKVDGVVLMTGGLANDAGLRQALQDTLDKEPGPKITVRSHPLSIHAGAIGAALWGAWRCEKLKASGGPVAVARA